MNNPDKNSKEYKIGYAFGAFCAKTCFGCLIAVVIALTAKFIQWLF